MLTATQRWKLVRQMSHIVFLFMWHIHSNGVLIELNANTLLGAMKIKSGLSGLFWPSAVSVGLGCRYTLWGRSDKQHDSEGGYGHHWSLQGVSNVESTIWGDVNPVQKSHMEISWLLLEKVKHRTSEGKQNPPQNITVSVSAGSVKARKYMNNKRRTACIPKFQRCLMVA